MRQADGRGTRAEGVCEKGAPADERDDGQDALDAIGLVGTLGAVLSYVLVYAFRLGEAMRYRFDPSLITVSVNDFLTTLIPMAACVIYYALAFLLIRDLKGASRASRALGVSLPAPATTLLATLLCLLPVGLALPVSAVQSSMWVSLVIAAASALLVMGAIVRVTLRVSPLRWASGVLRRGGRSINRQPSRVGPALGVAFALVLGFFVFAGYTNQLDFSGSHSLVLRDTSDSEALAVLALFDGNRAVVRPAVPAGEQGAYQVDLSEPYRVVYVTDGYEVTSARGITVVDDT